MLLKRRIESDCKRALSLERAFHERLVGRSGAALNAAFSDSIRSRKILFYGKPLPSFLFPHLLPESYEAAWSRQAVELVGVLERIGRQFLADGALRARLGFPAGADQLLEIEPGYSKLIVNSRLDMVWDGLDVSVLEVNTDSPAMMTFTDRVDDILFGLEPLADLSAQTQRSPGRTEALLNAMIRSYRTWGGIKLNPTIAIVDWAGGSTANELQETAADFDRFGCPAIVCDPRELSFVEGRLTAKGHEIDVVQRRVLFPDFIRRRGDLEPLLTAYIRGKVCMVNSLRSYVVGNKSALALLSSFPDEFDLSQSERALVENAVPKTRLVTNELVDTLLRDRESWVIKGAFGSGGHDVTLGNTSSNEQWQQVVDRAFQTPSVAQRLQPIPTMNIPVANGESVTLEPLYANWNPWVFGGEYAGATTRVSGERVVSITSRGGLLTSLTVPG